jgi:hypothetical protein
MKNKRSPLIDKPLHVPGQSVDELIHSKEDDMTEVFIFGFIFILLAMLSWYQWYTSSLLNPISSSVFAICAVFYSTIRIIRIRNNIKILILGRDGERIVAEDLDALRSRGCVIFHDLVSKGFNIDHVILSPQGIFAVETKTLSKPPKGEITFQDGNIIAGNQLLGARPIIQAKSEAKWLQILLQKSTGKAFPVKPILVFPGWFVQPMPNTQKKAFWILNPKVISSFIEQEPIIMSDSDMHLAAFHLSRYIRICN